MSIYSDIKVFFGAEPAPDAAAEGMVAPQPTLAQPDTREEDMLKAKKQFLLNELSQVPCSCRAKQQVDKALSDLQSSATPDALRMAIAEAEMAASDVRAEEGKDIQQMLGGAALDIAAVGALHTQAGLPATAAAMLLRNEAFTHRRDNQNGA